MRTIAAVILLAFAGAAGIPASQAQAPDYPWCVVYDGQEGDGGMHCLFVSYSQCLMTATPGSGANCVRNPRTGPDGTPARRGRR